MRNPVPRGAAILALVLAPACGEAPPGAVTWDGSLIVHGSLRGMFHEAKTGGEVDLGDLLPDPALVAVGALAGLEGEVTILGGEAYLTRPRGEDDIQTRVVRESGEEAALLVGARITEWREVVLEEPLTLGDLDDAVPALAAEAGVGSDRFPFLLEGEFEDLHWHVIDGRRLAGGGQSHEDHLRASVRMQEDRLRAVLVGFHSPRDRGIFTHHDSRTHLHLVRREPAATGHVDQVQIPAGSRLRLPAMTPGGERHEPSGASGRGLLEHARRRMTGGRPIPPGSVLHTRAQVQGPGSSFTTTIWSGADGRVRMEQSGGFVAGALGDRAWRRGTDGNVVAMNGPELGFVRGHELHATLFFPASRFHPTGPVESATFEGEPALSVTQTLVVGSPVTAYFSVADSLPLGVRIPAPEPDVVVTFSDWKVESGIFFFSRARFRQGEEEYSYRYDRVELVDVDEELFQRP